MTATPVANRPAGGQQAHSHWRSPKRQRSMSVTDYAYGVWDGKAAELGISRSEVLELITRLYEKLNPDLIALRDALLKELTEADLPR